MKLTRNELALIGAGAGFLAILAAVIVSAAGTLHPVSLPAEKPAEGVGRIVVSEGAAELYGAGTMASAETVDWFDPGEPMAVEWFAEDMNVACKEIGCPDWNLETRLYGAHGLTAEPWELDLMARIVSRECCGCSRTCWEAVADSILRRVETGYWGSTIYSVLSAVEETGAWAYTTYPEIWNGEIELYDEIRALCEERFYSGAEWDAMYFNLYGYAGWAIPMYEIDGVFFSQSPLLGVRE